MMDGVIINLLEEILLHIIMCNDTISFHLVYATETTIDDQYAGSFLHNMLRRGKKERRTILTKQTPRKHAEFESVLV